MILKYIYIIQDQEIIHALTNRVAVFKIRFFLFVQIELVLVTTECYLNGRKNINFIKNGYLIKMMFKTYIFKTLSS